MNKILSIIIPVYNKFAFTRNCLQDLSYLPEDHEVIIVDNASIDETQQKLEHYNKVLYYRNSENLGFAKACNIGYGLSSASNILFLNNDIRVKENKDNWTQKLIESCSTSLVGPTMGQLDSQLNFIKEANEVLTGNSYLSGWCIASSREIWSKLWIPRSETTAGMLPPQIFSEEFGLAYFEDTDLGFRARKLKIPFKVVDIPVVHFGKQSSKQLNTAMLYQQARKIFVKKWQK